MSSIWKSVFQLQQKKSFQSLFSPKSKKVRTIEQTEIDYDEYSNFEIFVKRISIQDPLNVNKKRDAFPAARIRKERFQKVFNV